MSDTTGLKVFDQEGMYRSETRTICASASTPRPVATVAIEFGEFPSDLNDASAGNGNADAQAVPHQQHMQPVSDALPFATLDELETMLDAHPAGLTKAYAQWLVRVCRASDARVIDLENQLKTKQADFNGMISEWHDLADENRRLKQQVEVDKLVCESQERTVMELRSQVDSLTRSDVLAT